jgi:hypothetical protein
LDSLKGNVYQNFEKNPMNATLAEGIPWGISLRQPTEDFCIRLL